MSAAQGKAVRALGTPMDFLDYCVVGGHCYPVTITGVDSQPWSFLGMCGCPEAEG